MAMNIMRRIWLCVLLVAGVSVIVAPAAAQEAYQSNIGRQCIQQWIDDSVSRLNRYDGRRDFNARKPWSVNRYGLFVAKGIASAYEPDDWVAKGGERFAWMWLTNTTEQRRPDWRNPDFNGAGLFGLRWYVRDCVRRLGGTINGSQGGTNTGPTIGGVNPCAVPGDLGGMRRFDNTIWEFGRDDGSVIARALTLVQGGGIAGYSHPNESRWTVFRGVLVFCRSDGTPSTFYEREAVVGGRRVLQGPYMLADGTRPGSEHVLRQVSAGAGSMQPGTVVGGVNLPGSDFHNFEPRRPEPALCRAACEADGRCAAWTYVRPGRPNAPRCWLKNRVPAPVLDDCCASGMIQ